MSNHEMGMPELPTASVNNDPTSSYTLGQKLFAGAAAFGGAGLIALGIAENASANPGDSVKISPSFNCTKDPNSLTFSVTAKLNGNQQADVTLFDNGVQLGGSVHHVGIPDAKVNNEFDFGTSIDPINGSGPHASNGLTDLKAVFKISRSDAVITTGEVSVDACTPVTSPSPTPTTVSPTSITPSPTKSITVSPSKSVSPSESKTPTQSETPTNPVTSASETKSSPVVVSPSTSKVETQTTTQSQSSGETSTAPVNANTRDGSSVDTTIETLLIGGSLLAAGAVATAVSFKKGKRA